jgi:hypothetical protein
MTDGVDLVGGSHTRGARVRAAYEVFTWLEKVFADAPPPTSAHRTRKER